MELIMFGGLRSESKKYDSYENFLLHISSRFTITQSIWQPGGGDKSIEESFDQIQ